MLRQHYGLRDQRFFILPLLGLDQATFRLSGCNSMTQTPTSPINLINGDCAKGDKDFAASVPRPGGLMSQY